MMSLWDALRMNMMISYQELVRTFLRYAQIRHLACGYFEERNTRHVKGITQRGKLIWDENHADDEYYTYPLEPLWTPGQSI